MQNVLVVGGTGFVGQNLARDLADHGLSVTVTTRKDSDETADQLRAYSDLISVAKVDLNSDEQVAALFSQARYDGMVMLAQTHLHGTSRAVINDMYPLALRCLENARLSGVRRIVLGSSIAVYSGEAVPYDERTRFSADITYDDDTIYPLPRFEVWVKRIVEQMFLDYGTPLDVATGESASSEDHQMEVAVLRLSNQYGPGYRAGGSPLGIANHVAAGKLPELKSQVGYFGMPIDTLWNMAGIFPPLYVRDSASALRTLLQAESLPRRIYNACSDTFETPRQQYEILKKIVPEAVDRLELDQELLSDEPVDVGYNAKCLKEDFGWESEYGTAKAFSDYIQWLSVNDF